MDELMMIAELLNRLDKQAKRRGVSSGVLSRDTFKDNRLPGDLKKRVDYLRTKAGSKDKDVLLGNKDPRSISLAMYFKIHNGLVRLEAERLKQQAA